MTDREDDKPALQSVAALPPSQREKTKAELARFLRDASDDWAAQVQFIEYQARRARVMYLALKKEGFTEAEALTLCKP
jgi:hypothetical protein